jgi:methylated-DNA-[protein]-cysteine S-methyltransferase
MKKSFNEKCYEVLSKVPLGKVTTYKKIAKELKSNGYRAVGNAMNKNENSFLSSSYNNVPCHRVICSDGKVGGFAYGQMKKIEILKKEGIEIIDGKVDLTKFGF